MRFWWKARNLDGLGLGLEAEGRVDALDNVVEELRVHGLRVMGRFSHLLVLPRECNNRTRRRLSSSMVTSTVSLAGWECELSGPLGRQI